MAVDHIAVIEDEAARVLAAYAANPRGKVPWSDRWSVNSVARHVASSHHLVARIIEGRPTADFGAFDGHDRPVKGHPSFPAWFVAGTEALVAQCRTAPAADPCWTPHPGGGGTVAFWTRHMANETLVHRWDAEAGVGTPGAPMDPAVAADAVDEYVDLAVSALRIQYHSPAGPVVRLTCTDTDAEWHLDLTRAGQRTLHPEPIEAALTLRGSAKGLLLWLYGRLDPDTAGLTAAGDHTVLARWRDLVPSA